MLIKQRLRNSGIRWRDTGAGVVLSLGSLTLSRGRWSQFRDKHDQYGLPPIY